MKVERKIASSETISVRKVKGKGSKGLIPGKVFTNTHAPNPYKGHAAAEGGDEVGYAIGVGAIGFGRLFQLQNRLDIALSNVFDGAGRVIVRRNMLGSRLHFCGHKSRDFSC